MRSAAKWIWILVAVFFVGGFLLVDTSGLLGRAPVTPTTAVASVNGQDILYTTWVNATNQLESARTEQLGRGLTLDERERLANEAFDQLVSEALLTQEFGKRGISVTDDEIRRAALTSPPPQLQQSSELQTDGQFDIEKYQRFLRSPAARQQGMLVGLEGYYRSELPRRKLFEQIASDVFVSDSRLWSVWQDAYDSAQVTFVAWRPETLPDSAVTVSDADVAQYYEAHKTELERPGRAVVSVVQIPRIVSPADSAIVRTRIGALRAEIMKGGGTTFDSVATRESADTASAVNGGSLGKYVRGQGLVPEFERVAFALKPGEVSAPVLTQFGYHIIKLDSRQGDTLSLRHIMLRIQQSDSSAVITDRRADSLATLAASQEAAAKFDSAAKILGLPIQQAAVIEGEPMTLNGAYVPSVSAWAFTGPRPGESSELLDAENAYYLARLDSLTPGGVPELALVREEIRRELAARKKIERLRTPANQLAATATTSSLEAAARAAGRDVVQTPMFTRVSAVPGLGRFNEAIGASFALPVGAVSAPVATGDGMFVLRVDRRVTADRAAWEAQKSGQREQLTRGLREQRIRVFLENLRKDADVEDNRKDIAARSRRASA